MVFAHLDDKADNHTYRLQGKVCVHKVQKCFVFFFFPTILFFIYISVCVHIYKSHLFTTLVSPICGPS